MLKELYPQLMYKPFSDRKLFHYTLKVTSDEYPGSKGVVLHGLWYTHRSKAFLTERGARRWYARWEKRRQRKNLKRNERRAKTRSITIERRKDAP